MKSALNGGLLVGTYDGATIEIMNAIGRENMFIFGCTEKEINDKLKEMQENGVPLELHVEIMYREVNVMIRHLCLSRS